MPCTHYYLEISPSIVKVTTNPPPTIEWTKQKLFIQSIFNAMIYRLFILVIMILIAFFMQMIYHKDDTQDIL